MTFCLYLYCALVFPISFTGHASSRLELLFQRLKSIVFPFAYFFAAKTAEGVGLNDGTLLLQ